MPSEEERRWTEERAELFRAITETSSEAVTVLDENLTVTYESASLPQVSGYPADEWMGRSLSQMAIHPEDLAMLLDQIEILKGQPGSVVRDIVVRYQDPGGSWRWIEATGHNLLEDPKVRGIVVNYRDITERKRYEAALKESEEKFSRVFFGSPIGLTITSLADGRFIDVNDAFLRMTGYARNEVIGRDATSIGLVIDEEYRQQMLQVIARRVGYERKDLQLRTKNGEVKDVLVSADHVSVNGVECIVGTYVDITARKHRERRIAEAEEQLRQRTVDLQLTNREMESFAYTVSHDLRAPLRSMSGFSEALLEEYTDRLDDRGKDYLQRIRKASRSMGELIDGLLQLSRVVQAEVHWQMVDLSGLCQDIAQELQAAEPERKAEFDIAPGLVTRGDSTLLRAALANLLGNAWKFSSRQSPARIEFGVTRAPSAGSYYVRDNGVGFDMERADRLFQPFQRLHPKKDFAGSGIGLATVKRIINRHGGRVWAESEAGRGAIFYFTLADSPIGPQPV